MAQTDGVHFENPGSRKTTHEQCGEIRIGFDQRQIFLLHPARQQRPRERPGSWAEFQHGSGLGPMSRVINAAKLELDGVTEPTLNGATVHAMRKDRASFAGMVTSIPDNITPTSLVWPRGFVSASLVSSVRPDLLHIRA
ncbi:hypothetical protein [Mesorhizobium sp. B2-3-15]|uniref:hypothetical protein n=1 Tax=Mesorhizobium sp. B2-3-15 TaxID=2589949 RepID=UPI001FEF26C0|nr:hypothetical protein [Mesorhizobium sp. B2-3-15]